VKRPKTKRCGICGGPCLKGAAVYTTREGRLVRVLACPRCRAACIPVHTGPGRACIECTRAAAVLCLTCAATHRARVAQARARANRQKDEATLTRYILDEARRSPVEVLGLKVRPVPKPKPDPEPS